MAKSDGYFKKGGDPRINKNGRPPVTDLIRTIGLKILKQRDKATGPDGKTRTRLERVLTELIESGDEKKIALAFGYIFGKPTESIDLQSLGQSLSPVVVRMNCVAARESEPE